ncbi:MAG: UvrD-helicase domain-containing protein [Myxococcota bacterium]
MSSSQDSHARERAVRTYDQNVVVLASAGTGKTSLLVERLLTQALEQKLPLSRVAAITFTEKAASEMRLRTAHALQGLSRPNVRGPREAVCTARTLVPLLGAENLQAGAERALRELPLATISTIHGFCARILRQYGHRVRLPSELRIDEGFGYAALVEDAWHDFLEGVDGPDGPHRDRWLHALERLDLREIREVAFALASFELGEVPSDAGIPDPRVVLGPAAVQLSARISAALTSGLETVRGVGNYLEAATHVVEAFIDAGPEALRETAERHPYETVQGVVRSILVGNPPESRAMPEATDCAREASRFLRRLASLDDCALSSALEVGLPFARRARESAVLEGRLPYDALLSLTRELLLRHESVRREVGERYDLLLVDEFQDTDPLQYEILFLLAADRSAGEGGDLSRPIPTPGKLFIVGDPKQSIYGFRRADIAACQRAIRHIRTHGGLELSLTTTWRAVPGIVEPLNNLFHKVFERATGDDPDLYPVYDGMESGRDPGGEEPNVEVWTVPPPDGQVGVEEVRRREGQVIAEWIATGWMRGREPSTRRYSDVAILFRAAGELHLYTEALRRWQIPFALDRSRNLLGQPEVQEFVSLLGALASPTDAPSVLGVLRSALGAVPDRELAEWAITDDATWCYTEACPDRETFPALSAAFDWLRAWHIRSLRSPADLLVSDLLEQGPSLPLHASTVDGAPRVAALRQLAQRFSAIARAEPSWAFPRVVQAFVGLLRSGASEVGGIGAEFADAVQLLTYHAAKGLEFKAVIMADLARSRAQVGGLQRQPARVGMLGDRGLFVQAGPVRSALSLLADDEERSRDRAETRRLFYVACTRASERLILVNAPRGRREPEPWVDFLAPWGVPAEGLQEDGELPLEAAVRHRRVAPGAVEQPRRDRTRPYDWGAVVDAADRAAERARAGVGSGLLHPSGGAEASGEGHRRQAGGASDEARGLARAIGIALHDVLERSTFRDPDHDRQLAARAACRAARATGLRLERVEAEVHRVLEAYLESDLYPYLGSVRIVGREVPFLLEEGADRWSGSIDLIYRSPEGGIVVADYKTDREIPASVPEEYRAQLAVYARAARRAFPGEPEPARELLYVRHGERIRC